MFGDVLKSTLAKKHPKMPYELCKGHLARRPRVITSGHLAGRPETYLLYTMLQLEESGPTRACDSCNHPAKTVHSAEYVLAGRKHVNLSIGGVDMRFLRSFQREGRTVLQLFAVVPCSKFQEPFRAPCTYTASSVTGGGQGGAPKSQKNEILQYMAVGRVWKRAKYSHWV